MGRPAGNRASQGRRAEASIAEIAAGSSQSNAKWQQLFTPVRMPKSQSVIVDRLGSRLSLALGSASPASRQRSSRKRALQVDADRKIAVLYRSACQEGSPSKAAPESAAPASKIDSSDYRRGVEAGQKPVPDWSALASTDSVQRIVPSPPQKRCTAAQRLQIAAKSTGGAWRIIDSPAFRLPAPPTSRIGRIMLPLNSFSTSIDPTGRPLRSRRG